MCERALELDPSFGVSYEVLALARMNQGRTEEAMEILQRSADLPGSTAAFLLPLLLAKAGRTQEAAERLRGLRAESGGRLPPGYAVQWVASAYALLGDMDEAFRLVDCALEERRFSAILLRTDQAYLAMRGHPRFQELLRRTGLG